jgi:hypothetical protein
MSQSAKLQMARVARLNQQLSELRAEESALLAELSKAFRELADGEIDLTTGNRQARRHVPKLPQISETDRARARHALRDAEVRRRLG